MMTEQQAALRGEITETGRFNRRENKWEINYSSILSRLIQEAGRWCEHCASDLFVYWAFDVDRKLDDGTIETCSLVFAFRKSGVDSNSLYENNKNIHYYYRAVWFLDITTDEGKIRMHLHK